MNNKVTVVPTKLRVGDEVEVMSGKGKGERGKIESFNRKTNRVFVAGINLAKRHTKPNVARQSPEGGILEKPMSIAMSNVMLIDPKTKKPTRVGYKFVEGKKVRFAKKSGTILTK